MTPEQIELVKVSFAQIAPIADTAATIFYDRLFAIDPPLRRLFRADMSAQRVKLIAMLATAVNNLNRWEEVLPQIQELGRRHVAYDVKPEDYDSVGTALLEALREGLGDAFTPDVRDAWIACYVNIATAMKAAAEAVTTEV